MRGVPVRIEIGPKDVDKGVVTVARRDVPGREGKITLSPDQIAAPIGELLNEIHTAMLNRARAFRDAHISDPRDYTYFQEVVQNGWALSYWCGDAACEAAIKEDTKATTRCIPAEQPSGPGRCIHWGQPAAEKAYFARAY